MQKFCLYLLFLKKQMTMSDFQIQDAMLNCMLID